MPHPMLPREGDFRICADVDAFKFLHREDAELRVLGVQTFKDSEMNPENTLSAVP